MIGAPARSVADIRFNLDPTPGGVVRSCDILTRGGATHAALGTL
jgi:hypothetical protein